MEQKKQQRSYSTKERRLGFHLVDESEKPEDKDFDTEADPTAANQTVGEVKSIYHSDLYVRLGISRNLENAPAKSSMERRFTDKEQALCLHLMDKAVDSKSIVYYPPKERNLGLHKYDTVAVIGNYHSYTDKQKRLGLQELEEQDGDGFLPNRLPTNYGVKKEDLDLLSYYRRYRIALLMYGMEYGNEVYPPRDWGDIEALESVPEPEPEAEISDNEASKKPNLLESLLKTKDKKEERVKQEEEKKKLERNNELRRLPPQMLSNEQYFRKEQQQGHSESVMDLYKTRMANTRRSSIERYFTGRTFRTNMLYFNELEKVFAGEELEELSLRSVAELKQYILEDRLQNNCKRSGEKEMNAYRELLAGGTILTPDSLVLAGEILLCLQKISYFPLPKLSQEERLALENPKPK